MSNATAEHRSRRKATPANYLDLKVEASGFYSCDVSFDSSGRTSGMETCMINQLPGEPLLEATVPDAKIYAKECRKIREMANAGVGNCIEPDKEAWVAGARKWLALKSALVSKYGTANVPSDIKKQCKMIRHALKDSHQRSTNDKVEISLVKGNYLLIFPEGADRRLIDLKNAFIGPTPPELDAVRVAVELLGSGCHFFGAYQHNDKGAKRCTAIIGPVDGVPIDAFVCMCNMLAKLDVKERIGLLGHETEITQGMLSYFGCSGVDEKRSR